ncbi:MAG: hypothetical protein IJP93_09090 [Bacteroidales bacterium]|nr:hypothetical protein [Bacteroidales bacterium]MBR0290993.1 hypothetical protein [Bacteroidales bacterium]
MIEIGNRIYWNCIHGEVSGVVEEIRDDYYLARLDNGKCVLVHELSISRWGK